MPKKAAPDADAPAKPDKGLTRIYPTHRRQAGDLVVNLPASINEAGDSESPEIIVTDKGADVPDALAQQLVDAREATLDAPDKE